MQSHIHHKQHVSISSINSDGSARSRTVSSPPTSPIPHHRASMTNLQQNFLGQQRTSGAGGSGTHFHRLSPSASSDQLRRASNTVAGPSLSQTSNTGLSTPGGNNITDSVLSFQILNIIQSNDLSVILPALQDYIVSCQTTPSFGSPLHLAIPICSKHVVEQIINTFLLSGSPARVKEPFWVNDLSSPDGDTPLHIAARMKNFEVLDILFRVEGIDDSIRNSAGKIPEEVVKRTDVAAEKVIELFRRSRLEFIHRTNEKLRACVAGRTTYALYDFLSRDRRVQGYYNARLIDINSPLDSLSDATLLHYAAKEDSAELVEWCLRKGADPEIKDRKGRKPIDLLPKKDSRARDRLKNAVPQPLLVQSTSSNTSGADSRISVQPPAVRGVLKKWVNFSSGWKSRYFALEKGTFSYYKSEADYPESCRGSIASRIAVVEFPEAKDKSRFDVVGKGSVRFSLQARSPADAKRWVWALMESKRWATDNEAEVTRLYGTSAGIEPSDIVDEISDDDKDAENTAYDYQVSGEIPPPPQRYDYSLPQGGSSASPQRLSSASNHPNHRLSIAADLGAVLNGRTSSSSRNDTRGDYFPTTSTDDLATLAHLLQVQMDVQNRVVEAVIESILQGQSVAPSRLSSSSFSGADRSSTSTPSLSGASAQAGFLREVDISNLPSLMKSSMRQVGDTVGRVLTVAEAKERKWRRREQKYLDRIKRLEAIIQSSLSSDSTVEGRVANSGAALIPSPLTATQADSGDDAFYSPIPPETLRKAPAAPYVYDANDISPQMNIPGSLTGAGALKSYEEDSEDSDILMDMQDAEEDFDDEVFYDAADGLPRTFTASSRLTVRTYRSPQIKPSSSLPLSGSSTGVMGFTSEASAAVPMEQISKLPLSLVQETSSSSVLPSSNATASKYTKIAGEDEAMTEPTAPVRTQSLLPQKKDPFGSVSIVASSSSILPDLSTLLNSHRGHLTESSTRSQLPLDPYKPKPAFQAWSFIKSAIGKDLSKVTLPVFFNEPLSLLQRLSEDIEFAELLALASHIGRPRDPDRKGSNPSAACAKELGVSLQLLESLRGEEAQMGRLLYVAAYAMSNYSSTVGRTTKPFNPLLGETFEYVNDEKEYRYISEQVCHHPPISACYVDSPDWAFWTEVNLKSKFWGSSLELHPLGNCHARLPLPVDVRGESGATEHYAWKKVTTTVNNLIVGKLSITHLGDMVIRNLRTGDECILTFRPKQSGGNGSWFGWGGSEGSGPTPAPTNDLFVNVGEIVGVYKDRRGNVRWNLVGSWGDKLTATRVGPPPGPSHQCLPSTLTLWARRAAHPLSQHLFNQTPFAMKLNELTEELKSFLPPTDSRLRLDQRAMEEGKWDDANKSKEQLEIVQRVRRRAIVSEYEATGRPSGPLDPPDVAPHLRNNGGGGLDGGVGGTPIQIGEAWWNPRWFVRTIDPETGEPHWAFTHEYWQWREKGVWPEWVLPVFEAVKVA